MSDYDRVEKSIRYLTEHYQEQPSLEKISAAAQLSPFYFQRMFQKWAGVSPKQFVQYLSVQQAKQRLLESRSVLDAAYETGLSGPGRLHDLMVTVEAMTPGEVKAGGKGIEIEWGVHPTLFGEALLAVTSRGICGLSFLDKGELKDRLDEFKARWPLARWVKNPNRTVKMIRQIFWNQPTKAKLNVLLKGTEFQIKIWEALLRIPPGYVQSYQDVAGLIQQPNASRAVGTAIGQNAIAYLIPCHRVIRETGVLGDYRWGSIRKKAILGWESARHHQLK